MEIDAPEAPEEPLGPGPKLGTVVAMVDFRPPAETGQQTYYQDHNARLEAQRRKADATERRVLETFYGVPASAWAEAAALPLVRGSAEQRMGHSQVSEWKKTLRVGDTIDVLHQGFWHEAVVRSVPAQTSSPYSSYSYASWSVGLTAFDGQLISCGRYDRPMAPRGMFVGDWRASLAVGDRVEARLDDNTWAMARVTAAADADEEEAKPAPAPARGGGVDICLVVIAGERFESSLEAGGVVNKGAEYRTLVRDTETFGSLRRTWAQQHGLQESELTLWSRPDPAPAPAPAPAPSLFGPPASPPAPADVRLDLESCARDLNLAGMATMVVTKNLDVVTTEATGLLELTVVVGGDETKLELPRSSPRLTRAGTHCKNQGLTKLKALELMGNPRDVLRRMLYEYLSKKDPRRCHSGEIGTLVRECATQEDTHRVLAKLAEEFGDGNFPLPALPDVEQAPLEIADGALKHESGLSTKKDSSHHYGYGSRYRDTNTSDAVSALLAPRGASAAMDIRASLGHVGLNWTPKRHGTVSPALAERIKVALLCAVRDRKRPHQERSLALLPNRILIHNIFSYLADVNSVRINGSLLRDETPPNGVYRAGYLRDVSRGKKKFVATPLSKLGDSPIGFLAPSIVVKVPVSLEIDLKPDWIKLVTPQLMEQANPYGGYARRRYSYTHTSNDASRQQLSTLIATLAHASADAGASVQEVAQSSILAGTPWASPEAPPAKLTKAAPHLAILEAARPSATAPMVPSPPAMSSTTLRPYQRRALAWMIAKEDGTFNAAVDDASNLDPAYREFQSCDGQHFYEPRRRAEFERERPTGSQFTHEPGGILADEMGLGKTVVVAALLVTRPRPAEELLPAGRWPQCLMPKKNDEQRYRAGKVAERLFELAGERSTVRGSGRRDRGPARRSGRGAATATDGGRASERLVEHKFRLEIEQLNSKPETVETSKHFKCVDKKPISDGVIKRVPIKATLVVMPALLVQQWVTELAKHAPSLKVLVYEGPADTRGGKGAGICAKDLAEQDVVLMNFETLQKDLGEEKFASPLLQVEWWRMMTDEAQMCKTGGPEMAVELTKINRWAVTGTPLSSSFDDLVSQLYFIELEPFMTVKPKDGIWEGLLDDAINHHRPPAIVALTNLVRLVMWRNLKKHVEDEVTLPELTVSNETVTSSPAESVLYAHRYHEMRGVLEKELRARKARGEFAAREDVDEAAKLRAGRGLRLPKAKGSGNAESPEAWTLALRAMTDHAALFGATPTSKCPKTLDTDEAALEALPSALAAVEQTRLDVAQAFLSVAFEAMSPDRLEDSDDDEEDDGWGPGSDDEESTKKKKKPVRYGPPDEESAAKALRKALSHLEDSDGNNIALWYKWLAGRQLSDLEEDDEDGPIFTEAKAALAQLVKNVTKPASRVAKWLKETKEERAQENEKRRAENRRRMAMGEDRDESDGLLNADPLKDIESYVKGDESILPHKRFIKHCRATLVHSARIAERQTGAAQAEKHLETVERNAARYGESLAANGLKRRGSDPTPASDDAEQPPKKKARKPAARKKKRGRAAAAEAEAAASEDTRPERFCDAVEPLPAAETSTKLQKLVEVVKGCDSKVVVFSQFQAALELAQRALKTAGLACVAPALLPVETRPAAIGAFINETGIGICLLTLDHSQSAGLTLTCASTVVLLDPAIDTAVEDQAIARVHRIGQSVPVTAIRLCQGATIDETIVELQSARRGAKRQKGALSATGQVRVTELIKLFAVEEEA